MYVVVDAQNISTNLITLNSNSSISSSAYISQFSDFSDEDTLNEKVKYSFKTNNPKNNAQVIEGKFYLPSKERQLKVNGICMTYISSMSTCSDQYKLRHDKRVGMYLDDNNCWRVKDYYVVAMTYYYASHGYKLNGRIGATLRITLESGKKLDVIIGDMKGGDDRVPGNLLYGDWGIDASGWHYCLNNSDNDPSKPMQGHKCGQGWAYLNIVEFICGTAKGPKMSPIDDYIVNIEPLDDMYYINLVTDNYTWSHTAQSQLGENFVQ